MSAPVVSEFFHTRKGRFVGVEVAEHGEWMHVRLVGDQTIRARGGAKYVPHADGDVLRVRKTLVTGRHPVTPPGSEATS